MLPASMFAGRLTNVVVRALDWLADRTLPPGQSPLHQKTGRKGEEAAYFYLRKLGYIMVARNFRSPHRRGEIDLIGWDKDTLCFIEVKTRTSHHVKPAEAAVDHEKLRELQAMAREYMRSLSRPCQWRIDAISVYFAGNSGAPQFELFRNVSGVA